MVIPPLDAVCAACPRNEEGGRIALPVSVSRNDVNRSVAGDA
jgi:hypothetical protein